MWVVATSGEPSTRIRIQEVRLTLFVRQSPSRGPLKKPTGWRGISFGRDLGARILFKEA